MVKRWVMLIIKEVTYLAVTIESFLFRDPPVAVRSNVSLHSNVTLLKPAKPKYSTLFDIIINKDELISKGLSRPSFYRSENN